MNQQKIDEMRALDGLSIRKAALLAKVAKETIVKFRKGNPDGSPVTAESWGKRSVERRCSYCGKECQQFIQNSGTPRNVCDDVCFKLYGKRLVAVYSNIGRLTADDRIAHIEEPLARLNAMFSRTLGMEAFIDALRSVSMDHHGYDKDEFALIAYIAATSSDCKQYVPIIEFKKYHAIIATKKKPLTFSTIMSAANVAKDGTCPMENRQNALFKREVSAMDATPEQKQAMLRRYAELGLDKIAVLSSPVASAEGIVSVLARELGILFQKSEIDVLTYGRMRSVYKMLRSRGIIETKRRVVKAVNVKNDSGEESMRGRSPSFPG